MPELFQYLVEATLHGLPLDQRSIGITVWRKPADWLPTLENDVRQGKLNLTRHLLGYYANTGSADRVIISTTTTYALDWKYNDAVVTEQDSDRHFDSAFQSALQEYFVEPHETGVRCVVTGEFGDWYSLDGNPLNLHIGNLLPLTDRLHKHLHGLNVGFKSTNLEELTPKALAEEAAPRWFRQWQVARAYGCARLAFYMGAPPFGSERSSVRLRRLCDALYYSRHHHNGYTIGYVVRNDLLPLLAGLDVCSAASAYRLTLEIVPLLIDSGYYRDAAAWMAFADRQLLKPFAKELESRGWLFRFARLRRKAEAIAESNPEDRTFNEWRRRASEQALLSENAQLALASVTARRWLLQGTSGASKQAFEFLEPYLEKCRDYASRGLSAGSTGHIDAANLSQLLLLMGIATCRVQPGSWDTSAGGEFEAARRLQEDGGHRISRRLWTPVIRDTAAVNTRAATLLHTSIRNFSAGPVEVNRGDVGVLLRCLRRMRFRL